MAAGGERSGYTFIAPDTFRVGMLGVLNGFCGTIDDGPRKGWGPIAAIYDEGKLLRFERTENSKINQSPITAEKMIEQIKLRVLPPAGNALFETTPEAALAIYERLVEILYPAPEQQP